MKALLLSIVLLTAVQLRAQSPVPEPIDVNREVGRVKEELQKVGALPISADAKVEKRKAILAREIAFAKSKQLKLQNSPAQEKSGAARDRKKAGTDNLQKFMDILRSMNPKN